MASKIIVIGSSNTDMVALTDKFPAPGETIMGNEFLMNPGGKGANQAVAASRCGGDVTFVGKVGADQLGQQSMEIIESEGIDRSAIAVDQDQHSGVAIIYVDKEGENSIVIVPGANMTLSSEDVDSAQQELEESEIMLLQLEIPLETISYAAKKGKELGKKVILNPAPATDLPEDLFPNLYMITPNETEAEILTGVSVTDEASAAEAAQELQKKGVDNVIITMGAAGAFVYTNDLKKLVPSRKVQAVDTTAAGDCFNGALAVALSQGRELEEAVGYANYAASIAVTRKGAQSSLPQQEDLEGYSAD